ncbi:MAG: acyl-CoA dehydrogenase [Deltaproteobacteria bacterium]|nr:acyl-CoA dehydrogenase [Deltaproteobacteria bacterium]
MDFDLSEEQELIRATARGLAEREIAPIAAELDEHARWPDEIVTRMAELGLMGVAVPEVLGGAGMDNLSYVVAMEEISRACASCGVIMSVQNSLVCDPILRFGTEAQKRDVLGPLARGEKIGCFGLSEPGSGSDASAMKTVARRDGDHWVLDGTKNFITSAPRADVAVMFAKTDPAAGHKGISAFLVPMKDQPGLSLGPKEKKLGIRAAWSSGIFMEGARIPAENLLGKEGEGFKVALSTLDGGRIGIAAQALGIAQAALDQAVRYSKERTAFGAPIARLQAIQFMIADMATELDAARLLTWRAARLKDAKVRYTAQASMAKLMASETATRVTHKALQVHGGYGYLADFPLERHYRDARITESYEGTSEIQRLVIAAAVLQG